MTSYRVTVQRRFEMVQRGYLTIEAESRDAARAAFLDLEEDEITAKVEQFADPIDTGKSGDWRITSIDPRTHEEAWSSRTTNADTRSRTIC